MGWIVGATRSCRQRAVSSFQMASSTRGDVMPAALWNPVVANFHSEGRCFVLLERKFVRNFLLLGLMLSGTRKFTSVAPPPPPVEKKPSFRDWKKRRPRGKQRQDEETSLQSVVVVESPSKAKIVAMYLGPSFTVLPSCGHVRDLASRAGSVRPDDEFNMLWEVPGSARPHINSIKAALNGAQVLVFASDPDREGEAIAWHLLEMLKMDGVLTKEMQVKRVVFHEITKKAVLRAMDGARDVSEALVNAYLARRALDYLIGFNLSPVLWRKLPGSRSVGRVQSAALRLICDREQQVEAFQRQEYWSVEAELRQQNGAQAELTELTLSKFRKIFEIFRIDPRTLELRQQNGAQDELRQQNGAQTELRKQNGAQAQLRKKNGAEDGVSFESNGAQNGVAFTARLSHLKGEKLSQCALANALDAQAASQQVSEASLRVESVKKGLVHRRPPVAYITSTLQEDACVKLGFGATLTMSIAQQLYEGVKLNDDEQTGLITYMRTDGFDISAEALDDIKDLVGRRYGQDRVPAKSRILVSKLRNAQESHEAIRPTDIFRLPSLVANVLEEDALQLYSLIWARTVACQMESAISSQVSLYVVDDDGGLQLRGCSSSISFPGFLDAYKDTAALGKFVEILQDEDNGGSTSDLSQFEPGDLITLLDVRPRQHVTEPPPRFSEGTLVKQLEELGIGRPSTYAPTLRTLQMRNYMRIHERQIFPEARGRMVSAFLIHYFPEFTDFALTSLMEKQLDEVSAGQANWKEVLSNFWPEFHEDVKDAMKVPISKVAVLLEELLAKQLFPSTSAGDRVCPSCKEGKVSLKLSRFGAGYFFGCSRHPNCLFKANMMSGEEDESSSDEGSETAADQWCATAHPAKVLGVDPTTQLEVVMRVGPYGAYVQLGEASKKQKPRRTTIPKGLKAEEVTLTKALELLSYPRELGKHPVEGTPIIISIGKFGFFLRHRAISANIPQGVRVENLTMDKAVEILKGKNVSRRGRRPHRKPPLGDEINQKQSAQAEAPQPSSSSSSSSSCSPSSSSRPSVSEEQSEAKGETKKKQAIEAPPPSRAVNSGGQKRGRGRPRKHVPTVLLDSSSSELLFVQGE